MCNSTDNINPRLRFNMRKNVHLLNGVFDLKIIKCFARDPFIGEKGFNFKMRLFGNSAWKWYYRVQLSTRNLDTVPNEHRLLMMQTSFLKMSRMSPQGPFPSHNPGIHFGRQGRVSTSRSDAVDEPSPVPFTFCDATNKSARFAQVRFTAKSR